MKKNNFKSLAAVLSLAMAATAVPVNANAAAAPKITVNKKTVYSGKTASVTVNNLKKGYTVQFSSTEGGVNFKQKKVKATGKKVTAKFTVKAAKSIADNTKTKIKAVVKNASGKKVKTVNQTVTLKQLAKSLTMKDLENTTVQVGAEVNADATISPKAAKGAYKKTFTSSDSSVLQVVNSGNGLFKAVAPGTATISVTAVNDKNKVVEGSKTLSVTVVEAEEDTNKPGDDINKPGDDNQVTVPTGPAITTDYQLTLTPGKTSITADSIDTTNIDVLLKAPTDATINKDMAVAVQLTLGTKGVGSLSQEDITILWNEEKQGWYGVVKFTSATLTTTTVSKLTAAISSVINPPADKDLKGLAANAIDLTLVASTPTVQDSVAAQAVSAVVESLDRITITFNKSVSRDTFMLDNKSDKVANGLNQQDNKFPLKFEMYIKDRVNETDTAYPGATYSNGEPIFTADNKVMGLNGSVNQEIDITHRDVVDIVAVPNNDRALTFVLANNKAKGSGENKVFTDNSKFLVTFIDRHVSQTAEGRCANYISDTTIPSVMTVKQDSMKSILVKFDQPIYSAADWETANNTNVTTSKELTKLISALNPENYAIDGKRLDQRWSRTISIGNRSYFGDAGTVKIELVNNTSRDEVRIILGKDGNQQCYFDAGAHVIQISNVGDHAALTETGTNNRITTKNFDFTIADNKTAPNFTVTALSPEQFRLTFNAEIAELQGIAVGQEFDANALLGLQLQFKDTILDSSNVDPAHRQEIAMSGFRDVTAADVLGSGNDQFQRMGLGQGIKCTRIENDADGNHQIKVEVTRDWTQLDNYRYNRKNYFNYELRFWIPNVNGKKITNAANGLTSTEIGKNITGDVIKQMDITTPVIQDITQITEGKEYKVTFSEPIQANNNTLADATNNYYAHAFTPAYNPTLERDIEIGTMTAEFYDKNTKLSYPARISGWADLEDQSIYVQPDPSKVTNGELPKGGNYTLIVRGVSDDVGNTSNTLTKDFSTAAAASDFKVLSILADGNYQNSNGIEQLDGVYRDGNPDAIYVEFSKQYMSAPIMDSVLNTQNWTINGASLPVGSTIISGIAPVGNQGKKGFGSHSGVTIYLPDNTLTNINATLIKIGTNVKAQDGTSITGKTTFTTQSIFTDSIFDGTGDIKQYNYILNANKSGVENK